MKKTGEGRASAYIGKKKKKSEKLQFGDRFLNEFRGSCLATSNENPGSFYASVNAPIVSGCLSLRFSPLIGVLKVKLAYTYM